MGRQLRAEQKMANPFTLSVFPTTKRRFAMEKHTALLTKKTKVSQGLRGLDPMRAGIDIGASSVFVCIADTHGRQEVREYPTFTADLRNMADWLKSKGVKSIAMESTGVYWIPVFEILDPMGFEVVLANAYHL